MDQSHHNIIQWNCRGLRSRREDIQLLIQKYSPAALCLQETMLHRSRSDDVDKDTNNNYHQSFRNHLCYYSSTAAGSGGVGIIVKDTILHRQIHLQTDLQAVAVSITLDQKAHTLCSVYIPPRSNLLKSQLDNLMKQLPSPVIFMGDFNAHNPIWGSSSTNPNGCKIENFVMEHNLVLFNNKFPTYYNEAHGSSSLLDLTICQPSVFLDFNCKVFENRHGSDHYPIQLTFNSSELPENERFRRWNFKKADWPKFKQLCQEQITENLFIIDSVDMAVYNNDKIRVFTESLINVASESIPMTTPNPTKKPKPWWDDKCKEAIKERNAAERKAKKHHTATNVDQARRFRAKCRRTIKHKKRSTWRQYVSSINHRTPLKKVWDKVRKITGKNNGKLFHHLKGENGDMITTKNDVANALGQQFQKNSSSSNYCTEFQKIKAKSEKQPINFDLSGTDIEEEHGYNKIFRMRDLKWSIKKSKNSTPGPDQIHYEILRHIPEETLKILLNILNEYWKKDSFPESWREAFIIPIPKPDKDLSLPINYRPIALTSCICKVMERMVNERLIWFLDKKKIISKKQCGYRRNRSTADHLVRLETFIRDAFRYREHVVAVFFDLEKAYDTTWKYGILKDLHKIGLRGNLPKFISNFMTERTFQVLLGTTKSDTFFQEEGVPQGAILSTTLFNLKINDIAKELKAGVECSLYVDDFLICFRAKTMNLLERRLQAQINRLQQWTLCNGFRFSLDKTVAMRFIPPFLKPEHQLEDPNLYIGNHLIKVVSQTKFLGLIWDSKLTFLPHINYLKKRCTKAMNLLKILSNMDWGADQSTLLQLYRSLIRSKLDYGCMVYGSAAKTVLKQLDSIHNQALRLCLGAFRSSPIESLNVEANEPPLSFRRDRIAMKYGLKLKANSENPAHNFVYPTNYQYRTTLERRATPAFRVRFQRLLDSANINTENITQSEDLSDYPLWDAPPVNCICSIADYEKDNTHPQVYKNLFHIVRNNFPEHKCIFTDGSKQDEKVAYALVTPFFTSSKRIPDGSSIFTAEATAVLNSLKYIKFSMCKKFLIFSDSLSLIQSIKNECVENPIITSIFKELWLIEEQGKEVVFCWVPGHCGIDGNEQADQAAKEALEQEVTPITIPFTDKIPYVKSHLSNAWQMKWDRMTNNKLQQIKPKIGPPFLVKTCRRDQVVLNRIRIGHSRLTHSFLMNQGRNAPKPECHFCCRKVPLTVEHVIIKCEYFSVIRSNYFNVHNLKEMFDKVQVNDIVCFLKETALYQQF